MSTAALGVTDPGWPSPSGPGPCSPRLLFREIETGGIPVTLNRRKASSVTHWNFPWPSKLTCRAARFCGLTTKRSKRRVTANLTAEIGSSKPRSSDAPSSSNSMSTATHFVAKKQSPSKALVGLPGAGRPHDGLIETGQVSWCRDPGTNVWPSHTCRGKH